MIIIKCAKPVGQAICLHGVLVFCRLSAACTTREIVVRKIAMKTTNYPDIALIDSIFHPTDFSPQSHAAFAHTLAIAVAAKAKLTIMHVAADSRGRQKFPSIRDTLVRW